MAYYKVFISVSLYTYISSLLVTSTAIVHSSDISCLKSIKDSVEDPGNSLVSWNFHNDSNGFICLFTGVDCWHPDENRVLNLRLSKMRLKGQFPRGLENCTSLTGLDLSVNEFHGTIPLDIEKKIPFVTSLDISFNNFSGEIPPSIANCRFLNVLKLDHNRLNGRIPQQLGQLERIKTFSVANNLLSGQVPNFVNGNIPAENYADNIRLCGGPLEECTPPRKINWKVIGYTLSAVSVMVTLACCVPWVPVGEKKKKMTTAAAIIMQMIRRKKVKKEELVDGFPMQETEISKLEKFVTRMSYIDLSIATENFSQQNIIGQGQMGTMYKATLPNGWCLAVKRLHNSQQFEQQFMSELKTLGRFRHDNLVPLLGFSIELKERLLVYKYISNGNLFDWLHSAEDKRKILEWPLRVKIAVGLARGLAWLHHSCKFHLANLNINSKSVLLDKNFEPKLSNFGRARRSLAAKTEFLESSSVKEDVYNFGIVVLEMITSKYPTSTGSSGRSLEEYGKDTMMRFSSSLELLVTVSNNCQSEGRTCFLCTK
ncbi:probably inactive leucine-rich repeat receptor-like protein kinase At5g48380 isoform X2 [Manihot esculenta]|uniref:probably inactive leucine-rich repeat receptor-like protein kinase At5g48380 isoform X2 n=1 Tax=Manihot esculenta TaxID=3983 RepID=UPI000B5D0A62|nr:probably inactive leucine-rich repeat receptor-like protein kinase At5g48380 isoform X2 [Manihot esculenta]